MISLEENMKKLVDSIDSEINTFSLNGQKILAKITSVYDADTVKAVFYLDNNLVKFTLRLEGIDTPEIRPKKTVENRDEEIKHAKKARNRLIQLCTDVNIELDCDQPKKNIQKLVDLNKKTITIKCGEFDKYGRLLATLECPECENINNKLIEENYAKKYSGGKKEKWIF